MILRSNAINNELFFLKNSDHKHWTMDSLKQCGAEMFLGKTLSNEIASKVNAAVYFEW